MYLLINKKEVSTSDYKVASYVTFSTLCMIPGLPLRNCKLGMTASRRSEM